MIDLSRIEPAGEGALDLTFSDGSRGRWGARAVIARNTALTRLLEDPAYFARAFVDAGALAWPSGLEFSGHRLHTEVAEAGRLVRRRDSLPNAARNGR
jgi:hypothetical protein